MASVSARVVIVGILAACGDDPARVRLEPISPCGQVTNETALRVVAYTGDGEQRRTVPPTEIDAFPASTEQLGVEVIGDGGRIVAAGKTAPLAFAELDDDTAIPIVMAPLDGFCPVGPLTEPRVRPTVARAGDQVLVVGGTGPDGEPLATAEIYDPATATFTAIDVPPTLMDPDSGLAGAVLTELVDGRVALTGTASHAIAFFDPATRRFSTPSLFDRRAFHAAHATGDNTLLVIGGCAEVVAGACDATSLSSGFFYDLDDVTMRVRGPALEPNAERFGATIVSLGEAADGVERFVLAGGFGEAGIANRFALGDSNAERIAGLPGAVAALDGGGVLAAFGAATASVLPPDRSTVVSLGATPGLVGTSMIPLEDGSVLAIGSAVARYRPTSGAWTVAAPAGTPPGPLDAPSLVRLPDGSVLVVGGAATTEAWIYRPTLVGPTSGSVFVTPGGDDGGVLTAPDPSTVDRSSDGFVLVATDDDLHARALVGGPRIAEGSISAIVQAEAGGVALIAQQTGSGRALVGRLVPGEPARIVQLANGAANVLCAGSAVSAAELAGAVGLAIRDGFATLSIGPAGATTPKASCRIPTSERGAWGLAAAGAGARVVLGPITVERAP